MQHPPLAVLTNSVLAAFNELRHCAPRAIQASLTRDLEGVLRDVRETCKWYAIMGGEAGDALTVEKRGFKRFMVQLEDVAVPFILGCWDRIWVRADE